MLFAFPFGIAYDSNDEVCLKNDVFSLFKQGFYCRYVTKTKLQTLAIDN